MSWPRGINVAEVVRRENQRQAVNQVSVGNCVTSLRLLGALDWAAFFERTNLVDPVLRQDPAGAYAKQDFATRDRYRQAVEKLAKHSRSSEVEIARRAVDLARRAQTKPATHVGYHLVGDGAAELRGLVDYCAPCAKGCSTEWCVTPGPPSSAPSLCSAHR